MCHIAAVLLTDRSAVALKRPDAVAESGQQNEAAEALSERVNERLLAWSFRAFQCCPLRFACGAVIATLTPACEHVTLSAERPALRLGVRPMVGTLTLSALPSAYNAVLTGLARPTHGNQPTSGRNGRITRHQSRRRRTGEQSQASGSSSGSQQIMIRSSHRSPRLGSGSSPGRTCRPSSPSTLHRRPCSPGDGCSPCPPLPCTSGK